MSSEMAMNGSKSSSSSSSSGLAWGSTSYSSGEASSSSGGGGGGGGADDWAWTANLTTDEYLEMMLGPKQVDLKELVPMTVMYVIMFLTGVAGNLAVCLVIIRNRSMHTATNYYLFSLAVSDLVILLLGLPNELIGFWHQYPYLQGESFCKIRSYVSELASYASVLTIVAFSVERYLAICRPLHVFESADFNRVISVLAVAWSVAGLAAFPYFLFTTINYIDKPLGSGQFIQDSAFCALLDINITPQGYPMHELSFITFFLIPSAVLLCLYISMGVTLRGSIRKNNSLTNHVNSSSYYHHHGSASVRASGADNHIHNSRKQIIRMLAAVVMAFFLCWTPFHAQRLGYVYFKQSPTFRTINEYLMYVSGVCYYLSSTINPILYNLMSVKYRQAFRRTLCGIQNTLHNDGPATGGLHLPAQFRGRASTWDTDPNAPLHVRRRSETEHMINHVNSQHHSRRSSRSPSDRVPRQNGNSALLNNGQHHSCGSSNSKAATAASSSCVGHKTLVTLPMHEAVREWDRRDSQEGTQQQQQQQQQQQHSPSHNVKNGILFGNGKKRKSSNSGDYLTVQTGTGADSNRV